MGEIGRPAHIFKLRRNKPVNITYFAVVVLLSVVLLSLSKLSSRVLLKAVQPPQGILFNESSQSYHKGHVHASLHRQALSHQAFHSRPLKLALAQLASRWPSCNRTAVFVGVEFGGEMKHFADHGFRVIGFEPNPRFASGMREQILNNTSWDAQLYEYAAGEEPGHITFTYQDENPVHATVVRLNDYVHESIAVLSVDVQGVEDTVLKGATKLLNSSIAMIWFEVVSCNDRVASILDLLDDQYVLFDFVPWGHPKKSKDGYNVRKENYAFNPKRPSSFKDYLSWLCTTKEQEYKFLQTDIVAIRRSFLPSIVQDFDSLGNTACGLEGTRCQLRKFIF